jgi:hypothetical protein
MRPYEVGDLVCVDMATAQPIPGPVGAPPTEPLVSAEARRQAGWLPGVIRGETADGLHEVELEGRDLAVIAEPAGLRPRAAGELCAEPS